MNNFISSLSQRLETLCRGPGVLPFARVPLLAAFGAALLALSPPAAAATPVTEGRGKALFLVNFVKYVEWPAGTFAETNAPLVVGVAGSGDVEAELKAIAKTATVGGHPVVIRTLAAAHDVKGCHMIFIPSEEKGRAGALLDSVRATPVLTVSDGDKFAVTGGMVGLLRQESRIKPQVNLGAAEVVGLKISSKLLAVSEVIRAPAAKK